MTRPRSHGRPSRRCACRARSERGSAGIDFLLIAPVLVATLFALVLQWGIKMQAAREVDAAAREGAVAAARFNGTQADGSATAATYLTDIGSDVTHVQVAATRGAVTAEVEVRAQVRALIPFVDLTVTATARQPVEAFSP